MKLVLLKQVSERLSDKIYFSKFETGNALMKNAHHRSTVLSRDMSSILLFYHENIALCVGNNVS